MALDSTVGAVVYDAKEDAAQALERVSRRPGLPPMDTGRKGPGPVYGVLSGYRASGTPAQSNKRIEYVDLTDIGWPKGQGRVFLGRGGELKEINILNLSETTAQVGERLSRDASAWGDVKGHIRGSSAIEGDDDAILTFIRTKGIRFDRDTVVLWGRKSGAAGGAYPEQDHNGMAMCWLAQYFAGRCGYQVICVGDLGPWLSQALRSTLPHILVLGTYWSTQEGQIFQDRRKQQRLFYLLKILLKYGGQALSGDRSRRLVHVGMRSGGLDFLAFGGHRVVYLLNQVVTSQGQSSGQWQYVNPEQPQAVYTKHPFNDRMDSFTRALHRARSVPRQGADPPLGLAGTPAIPKFQGHALSLTVYPPAYDLNTFDWGQRQVIESVATLMNAEYPGRKAEEARSIVELYMALADPHIAAAAPTAQGNPGTPPAPVGL